MKNILITGGAGFIGGTLLRRLLRTTKSNIHNIDKLGYASDISSIQSGNCTNTRDTKVSTSYFIICYVIKDV